MVNQRLNWTDAGLECRSLHKDAHLLVINDVQKQWAVAGWLHSTGRNLFHIIYQQDCLSAGQTAIINFRPHRSRPTMYVGAAYCYRRSSVVCLSVCHDREPCKNSTVGLLLDGYVSVHKAINRTRMWANAQPDGRPAEHWWRPLFNAAKFGWRPLLDDVQQRCQDAKPVEICRGAPNSRTDLSR